MRCSGIAFARRVGKPGLTFASPRDVECWRVSVGVWRARGGEALAERMERQLNRKAARDRGRESGARAGEHTQGRRRAGARARAQKCFASVRARPMSMSRVLVHTRAPRRARAPKSSRQARIPSGRQRPDTITHVPRCVCCPTHSESTRNRIHKQLNPPKAEAHIVGLDNNHLNARTSSNTHTQWEDRAHVVGRGSREVEWLVGWVCGYVCVH
jgi:hypothetical protein